MDISEAPETPHAEVHPKLLGAKYISIERRSPGDTVFLVDDTPFRSSMPRATHWSIAWSDLMMTMFVLFLSLFVYKTANQDFLNPDKMEVVGGNIGEALNSSEFERNGLPFAPIGPSLPLITDSTVSKTEAITLKEAEPDLPYPTITRPNEPVTEYIEVPVESEFPQIPQITQNVVVLDSTETLLQRPQPQGRDIVEPRPLVPTGTTRPDRIQDIYRLSKEAIAKNNLKNFASIDLVPDKTMRIILTGDLLFATGEADLSNESRDRLEKLATAINSTPYVVNVVGHTDNVPISSSRYASNWELSVSRASAVARFLIENMEMSPHQFIVSGYASYNPIVPNSSARNRMKNRRVEIIISKKLPRPVQASTFGIN